MSNFDLNLSLNLLYNEPVDLSFDAFAKNEEMKAFKITKVSEAENQLVIKINDNTATFTKVAQKTDFDYDAFQKQVTIFDGYQEYIYRSDALKESKDHSFHINVKVETEKDRAYLEIQALFFAALYQTDEVKPVGVHIPENNLVLSYGDYEEFGVNQINEWGLYCAWINFIAAEGKKKTTLYSTGLKKLGEKDVEITVKKDKVHDAHHFIQNVAMHSITSTASYKNGETTTNNRNGKVYEFTKKKSIFLDCKVLALEKW